MKKLVSGFTLIELLITMVVSTTVGTLILGVFIVSMRSTTKINNLQVIRQSGNYTISQLTRMMQFAQQFEGVSTNGTTFNPVCQVTPNSSASLQTYSHVRITSYDGGQTTFSCSNNPLTVASNSASLIDTNSYIVSNCSFTCSQVRDDAPETIGITFTLSKRNTNNLIEDPAPLQFQTSVTMRNLGD